ncbi:MAG: translation initiation factor IF-2 [Patescibacteria group bacterium]
MNVAELARKLQVTSNELLEKLPHIGFDIGRRAIKVDDRLAEKIIDAWKRNAKLEKEKARIEEIRGTGKVEDVVAVAEIVEVKIPQVITVREFASILNLPINKVLMELMKNGVLASMNERIDFDTASIIGEELGFKVSLDEIKVDSTQEESQQKIKDVLCDKEGCVTRPPVIVVMGHVDHGKTKILDSIRTTDVVAGESGGITQHIGAYQVHRNNRLLTFIDTPGHEAFTAMRSRGARVADIAVLVVAADDGVQPQTKEAIKIIQDAGLPFVVAINKIDKPEANIEKAKQDLSSLGLLPEDWGGEVICVPVSAKTGEGIEELLETLILIADMNKETIMANPDRPAIGTIIESHVDKGEGPVATILVQSGTLCVGNILCVGDSYFGKVRSLRDYKGMNIECAPPGTPIKILGLKVSPDVGSVLEVSCDEKNLNKDIKNQKAKQEKDFSVQSHHAIENSDSVQFVNLILKGDVLGSVEAIIESLAKLETSDIKVKIIAKGLGMITEADVLKAEATGAKIIGFHIKPSTAVSSLARDKNVDIKLYDVIYHLIEDVQKEMLTLIKKEMVQRLIGKFQVIKVFRRESKNMILGGRVTEGYIEACDTVVVVRNGLALASGKVTRVELSRQVIDKVNSGQECGVNYEGNSVADVGDELEFYREEEGKK